VGLLVIQRKGEEENNKEGRGERETKQAKGKKKSFLPKGGIV